MRTIQAMLVLSLAGCGLADTGTAAATAAALKAKELQQAQQTEARIRDQLEQAGSQAAQRREEAEAASR